MTYFLTINVAASLIKLTQKLRIGSACNNFVSFNKLLRLVFMTTLQLRLPGRSQRSDRANHCFEIGLKLKLVILPK